MDYIKATLIVFGVLLLVLIMYILWPLVKVMGYILLVPIGIFVAIIIVANILKSKREGK